MSISPSILYCTQPGLLAKAHASAGLVAIAEGKQVRDASPCAHRRGVFRGQSVLRARRLCPALLVVPLEQVEARLLSQQLYDVLADLSPMVEPAGPDAAFAVIEPSAQGLVLPRLAACFPELTPLLGAGPSKLVARTLAESGAASFALAPSRFLWPQDTALTGKLERLGLDTIGAVAQVGEAALRFQLGAKSGSLIYRRSLGLDSDPVLPLWPLPQVACSRRFDLEPLENKACLETQLVALAKQAARELASLRRYGRVVTLRIETERGASSPSWRPPWPIQSPSEVLGAARRLLALQPPRAPVTGLLLTVTELELPQAESLSLFDTVGADSRRRLEAAKRFIVARYGTKALTTLGKVPIALRDRRRALVGATTAR